MTCGGTPTWSYYPLPSMPVNTRPSNAEAHPGRVVMEGQRVRRSKKQIEVDEARKKAAASAASRRAEEDHQRVLRQLKESEDAVEREEEAVHEHTARPDLRYESLWCQQVDVFTHRLAGVRDTRYMLIRTWIARSRGTHGKHWSELNIQNGR